MPSTLPVPVVLAGASCGPVCSGTPSKPIAGSDALELAPVVPALPDVPVFAEVPVPVPVEPAEPEAELELDEPPQAARARAHRSAAAGIKRRIGSAKVAGYGMGGVGSVCRDVRRVRIRRPGSHL